MGGPLQLYLSLNMSTPRFVPSCGGLRGENVRAQATGRRPAADTPAPAITQGSILTAGRPPLEDIAFAIGQSLPRLHTSKGRFGSALACPCVNSCSVRVISTRCASLSPTAERPGVFLAAMVTHVGGAEDEVRGWLHEATKTTESHLDQSTVPCKHGGMVAECSMEKSLWRHVGS